MSKRVVLTLLVIGMLLSLLVQNAGKTTWSVKANRSLKNYSSASMYDNVTIHEGDLVINGTQTFVIENCTYIQTGYVEVENSGSLTLKHAQLYMNLSEDYHYYIRVAWNATFSAENSTISASGRYSLIFSGKGQFRNTNITYCQMFATSRSQVTLIGSNADFMVGSYDAEEGGGVYAENSTISWLRVLSDPYGRGHASINRSNAEIVEIWFYNASVTVQNLQKGYIGFFNTVQNISIARGTAGDMTIVDSNVSIGFRITISHSEAFVSDCTLGYLDAEPQSEVWMEASSINVQMLVYNASATIIGSYVSCFSLWGDSNARVTNCTLGDLDSWSFVGLSIFNYSRVTWLVEPRFSNFTIYGNVSMSQAHAIWTNSSMTRDFNIIAMNSIHDPLADANLSLYDQNNTPVWIGPTDSLGRADFNITFIDSNYTDTLRLEAVDGNHSVVQNITFLSDTPVIVQMGILGDINGDWTVDIYDAITLANAYNFKLNDPNWNAGADLNGDNIVDLYDAILLASNYGKTV